MDFRQDLVKRFREYTDDELLEKAHSGTLIDLAQSVVEDELKARNIAFEPRQIPDEQALEAERSPAEEHETVARFSDTSEAYILRGRLEAEGIPAYVLDAHLAIANPFLLMGSGVRVQVPCSFVSRAHIVIQAIDDGEHDLERKESSDASSSLDTEAALLAFAQDPVWIKIWRRPIANDGQFSGFNPFAVVLGPIWFFFRKMYGLGIAVLLIDIAVVYFFHFPGAFFVPRILIGFFANIAYYKKARHAVNDVMVLSAKEATRQLSSRGGISIVGAITGIFLVFASRVILFNLSV
ncbi:MAG TPA: DUF2628 domain-containing protein [Herminiimonas sp.]|nr:DUF2628 domain-containing protein [Herminiimonas sp.]